MTTATTNTSLVKMTIEQLFAKPHLLKEHEISYTHPDGKKIFITSIRLNNGKDKATKKFAVTFEDESGSSWTNNITATFEVGMSVSIPPTSTKEEKEPEEIVTTDPVKSTLAQVIEDGLLLSHYVRFTSKGIEYDIRNIAEVQDGKCSIKYVSILNTMQILSARTPLTTVVFLYPYNNPDTTPPKEDPVDGFRLESKTIRGENITNFNDLTAVVELVKDFSNDSKLALINLLILQMSDPATSPNTTTNPAPTKVDTNPANNPKPVTATKPTTTTNDEDRDKSYESLYPALCEWKQLRDSGKTIKSFSPEQSHGAGYASIVEELKVIDWLDGLHPTHKSQILSRWEKGEIKFSLLNGICKPNYHVHYPKNATLIALGRMEPKSQAEYKAAIAAKKSA